MTIQILLGDARQRLQGLPAGIAQTCVTSPPYFGLRCYGTEPAIWGGDPGHDHEWVVVHPPGWRAGDTKPGPMQHAGNKGREDRESAICACGAWKGELGLEPTPAMYVEHLVAIFSEVRRVLRHDGTLWLNVGDAYAANGGHTRQGDTSQRLGRSNIAAQHRGTTRAPNGFRPKELMLVPYLLALALQADGWWARSQIVWAKRACMPESVTDRPTNAWEPIFLFSKSARYYYDREAVKEPAVQAGRKRADKIGGNQGDFLHHSPGATFTGSETRNMRNVWWLSPEPSKLDHYAGYPTEVPRRAIAAGTSERGQCPRCGAPWRRGYADAPPPDKGKVWTGEWLAGCRCFAGAPVPQMVLDPFAGTGTTLVAADRLGRDAVGIELSEEYAMMAEDRVRNDAPMFTNVEAVA